MYSTAALILANGHIRDLMADADLERRARLARANRARTAAASTGSPVNPVRRVLQILRGMPRATAR